MRVRLYLSFSPLAAAAIFTSVKLRSEVVRDLLELGSVDGKEPFELMDLLQYLFRYIGQRARPCSFANSINKRHNEYGPHEILKKQKARRTLVGWGNIPLRVGFLRGAGR